MRSRVAPPALAPAPSLAARLQRWPGWVLVLAPAALHLVLALLVLQPAPFAGGDNATYVALARSIAERGTYTEVWDPALRPATLYPPVFPLLLALVMKLGGTSWLAFKLLTIVLSTAGVAMAALWFRRVLPPLAALLAAGFLACNPALLEHTHLVLSEVPFWGLTVAAFWALSHVGERSAPRDGRWLALAAASAVLAWLTRSAGLPLIAAVALWLLWHRRWRLAAVFGAVVLPPMVAWTVRGQVVGARGYGSYLLLADPYRPELGHIGIVDLIPRALANAGKYFSQLAPQALLGAGPAARYLGMLTLGVAVAWLVVRLFRAPGVLEFWLLLYAGVVLVWPEAWAGERFVLAALPALIVLLADAGQWLIRRSGRTGLLVVVGASGALGLVALTAVALQARSGIDCRGREHEGERFACVASPWHDLMVTAADARGQLPAGAVVIARKPTLFYVLSGYQSIVYPYSAEPDSLFAAARAARARYLLVDNSEIAPLYLHPILRAGPARFCAISRLSQPEAVLMRIEPPTSVPATGSEGEYVSFKTCQLPL